jgi:mRNA interferase MazF
VVVQASHLPLSTWVVCPTSTSANPATWRPEIDIDGTPTRVLTEQITAVDPQRLGQLAGRLSADEIRRLDRALLLVLDLAL